MKQLTKKQIYKKEYDLKNRERNSSYKKKFRKDNWFKFILKGIKNRCENPSDPSFKWYGKRNIKVQITQEELKELYIRDKAFKMAQPSIDRIDNDGHYEYENCRFIELRDNIIKAHIVAILQYNLNGKFIKEWNSISQASKELNISKSDICQCCKKSKRHLTAGGFKWEYKGDLK